MNGGRLIHSTPLTIIWSVMSNLVSVLPGETRKHFINMKNVRDAHERELDATRLDELNGMAVEKKLF
jgi:hypothetical protein